jgi:hypothetical protein
MASKPDLRQVKRRIREDGPPQETQEDGGAAWAPKMGNETRELAEKYMADVRSAGTEVKKVDVGELPEGVTRPDEVDDGVFYSNAPYDNLDTRRKIEGACSEMDFADLVITGRVSQQVPILPNKLEVVYRSLLGSETYWIGRSAESRGGSPAAMQEWMGYARLSLSVVQVNGVDIPGDSDRDLSDSTFGERFNALMGMGEPVLRMLLVNLGWFNVRVDGLYADDFGPLKNG